MSSLSELASQSNGSSSGLAFIDALSDIEAEKRHASQTHIATNKHPSSSSIEFPKTDPSLDNIDDDKSEFAKETLDVQLSPSELESSVRIRQKYGLNEQQKRESHKSLGAFAHNIQGSSDSILIRNSSPSYEVLFRSIDEQLANFSENASIKSAHSFNQRRFYGKEVASIRGMMEIIVRKFMDELVSTGHPVENEHPLLPVLIALNEIFLHHGWRGNNSLVSWNRPTIWSLIDKIERVDNGPSASAIENVLQFTTLRTSSSKLRAWIQLALMNKSLGPDFRKLIAKEESFIRENYEDWSCIRDPIAREEIPKLLMRMDNVDFNLYVQEQFIPKGEFSVNWSKLFLADYIDFSVLDPPVFFPSELLTSNPSNDQTAIKPINLDQVSMEELLQSNRKLREENHRLRRSLVMHLDQRNFHEEMASKTLSRLAILQDSYDRLSLLYKDLTGNSQPDMRVSSASLQTKVERDVESTDRHWRQREKELVEQLRVAIALKDEYKKKLKEQFSIHHEAKSLPDLTERQLAISISKT